MAGTTGWKVGAKKATTWGTAVAVGVSDGVLITQESLPEGLPDMIEDQNVGQTLSNVPMAGNVKVEGSFTEAVRYEGFERRLSQFCNDDTVAVLEATKVWTHALQFKPSNTGKFMSIAIDKGIGTLGSAVWEYPSVKLNTLELSHDNGKLIANWGVIANKCNRGTTVNDATAFGALTFPTIGNLAVFPQLTVYMKEVTGAEGNTVAGDEMSVTACTISLNRNLSGDFVCGTKAGTVDEPETNGLPEGSVKMSFSQYTQALDTILKANVNVAATRQPKIYKLLFVWKGNLAGTSAVNYYRFAAKIAAATITSAPANAGSPGAKVPVEMTLKIASPNAAGNGSDWTWATAGGDPVRFEIDNSNQNATL